MTPKPFEMGQFLNSYSLLPKQIPQNVRVGDYLTTYFVFVKDQKKIATPMKTIWIFNPFCIFSKFITLHFFE